MKIRRYLRQQLVQTALLKLPDAEEIPCEIKNFCQAGLFLKLLRPGLIRNNPSPSEDAEVVFISYRAESVFKLTGKLSHISATGAGVTFNHPPSFQALLALQEAALTDPLAEYSQSPENAQIQQNCVAALKSILLIVQDKLPAQIAEHLTKPNTGSNTALEIIPIDEESSPIKQLEQQAIGQFIAFSIEQARSFVVPDLSLQPESGAIYSESHLQRLALKDWMNLMDKIIQLESRFDMPLKTLESRFSIMVDREIANHNNPYGPSVLLYTFHYTMKELRLSNDQRESVYEALTLLLDELLDKLYFELHNVSKSLEPSVNDLSMDLNSQPAGFSTEEDMSLGLSPDKSEENSQGTPPPTLHQSILPASLNEPAIAAKHGLDNGHTTSQKRPHSHAAPQVSTQQRILSDIPPPPDAFTAFVVLTRYAEAQANKVSSDVDQDLDHQEIIDALAKQLQTAEREQIIPYYSAPKLQSDLALILGKVGHEKTLAHVTVRENQLILGLLMDALLADLSTPSCIAPYIMKLQIPLLIASFADPGLLYARTHPVRDFLNQLDLLAQATNTQGEFNNPQVQQSLDDLFDHILKEAPGNPRVFHEASEAMEKLTSPLIKAYTSRLERLVESCEGGQRLEHARQLVDREIDNRLGGKTVPSVVTTLLDAGWRQLLVLTYLRQGKDNDEWRKQLGAIDLLMGLLGKQGSTNLHGANNLLSLKIFLREGLSGINAEPMEVKHVLEKIDRLLPEDGSEPGIPAFVDFPPTDTAKMEREKAQKFRLAAFKVGDWLKFISSQNIWVPLRLSWIGQDPARYVFTNRRGIKNLELDSAKFAQMLDEKRASRIESLDALPLIERTAKSLLSTLRNRLR